MNNDSRGGEARPTEIREMRRDGAGPSRRGLMGAGAGLLAGASVQLLAGEAVAAATTATLDQLKRAERDPNHRILLHAGGAASWCRFRRIPGMAAALSRLPARPHRDDEEFVPDSALKQGGFEPAVPPRTERPCETQPGYHRDVEPETRTSRLGMPSTPFRSSGTEGSNPASSSRQSVSAVNAEAVREKARTLAAFCGWLGT
jgi:hypothetical protein